MQHYSIIVPAHNEEKYIEQTLTHLKTIDFPRQHYEVIVVENGSADKTYATAKKFEDEHTRVYSRKTKGVSKARNFGYSKASPHSNWLVFLDADTLLKKNFLKELDNFLAGKHNLVCGTAEIWPTNKSKKALRWFRFYNMGHKLFHNSFSIQIMRADAFAKVKYDETINIAEDQKILKDLRRHGDFFFLETKQVETSTRRFDEVGWTKLFLKWMFETLLPEKHKRTIEYSTIR